MGSLRKKNLHKKSPLHSLSFDGIAEKDKSLEMDKSSFAYKFMQEILRQEKEEEEARVRQRDSEGERSPGDKWTGKEVLIMCHSTNKYLCSHPDGSIYVRYDDISSPSPSLSNNVLL